jgi:hypothetical protein
MRTAGSDGGPSIRGGHGVSVGERLVQCHCVCRLFLDDVLGVGGSTCTWRRCARAHASGAKRGRTRTGPRQVQEGVGVVWHGRQLIKMNAGRRHGERLRRWGRQGRRLSPLGRSVTLEKQTRDEHGDSGGVCSHPRRRCRPMSSVLDRAHAPGSRCRSRRHRSSRRRR